MAKSYIHIPIMLNESIEAMNIKSDGIYVDCTTNRGGHAIEIVKRLDSHGTLICIDLDSVALLEAKDRISNFFSENKVNIKDQPAIHYVNDNYRNLEKTLDCLKIDKIDGALADLGLSSEELDISGRGFTFQKDEPLYMTFLDTASIDDDVLTAEYIVNNWSEETLATILWGYADETYRGRIARAICEARKVADIKTTTQLVKIIADVIPRAYKNKKGSHFATRTFQALRIAVNDELSGVRDLLQALKNRLNNGGRAAIITFHSTEDRIVKQKVRELIFTLVYKKPLVPTEQEIKANPRARSAKLRVISN